MPEIQTNSLSALHEQFPCRENQVYELEHFYSHNQDTIPCAVYIWGIRNTGKSCVTRAYLKSRNFNHAIVNCVECYTPRLIYEPIFEQLLPEKYHSSNCDTLSEFFRILKLAFKNGDLPSKRNIIVLDAVEYLDNRYPLVLAPMRDAQEITKIRSLSVIFISHLARNKFSFDDEKFWPVDFEQYTKEEALKILMNEKPTDIDERLYMGYLSCCLNMFSIYTRDIVQLRALVNSNFDKYIAPVKSGEINPSNQIGLWRNISPQLQESLSIIYEGELSESTYIPDLPFYSKFFLIAAYIASHNPPKYDKRLFLKNQGKRRHKKKATKSANDFIETDSPKLFPLDRLLAIFYSIMENRASLTANLIGEITTLLELNYLERLGESVLDNPKYRCIASYELTDAVAHTVGFNLRKFLLC